MELIKAIKKLILLTLLLFSIFPNNAFSEGADPIIVTSPVVSYEAPSDVVLQPIIDPHDINDVTYASFGSTTLNIENLNSILSANKYQPFSTNAWALSTGSRNISGKIMTGSEGNFTLENKELNTNGFKSYLSSSFSIILDIGYVVYSTENIKIYPFIGAGIGRVNVDIIKDEKTPSFNEILTKPERGVPISNTSALIHLGVAGDYLIKIGKSKPQKGGIVLGLKAGYVFSVYSTGFQLKGAELAGTPEINNNGAYIKLYVGYTDGILAALGDIF